MATIRGRRILWPRSSAAPPPPPPQPSRAPVVPNSRFVEGSMSDRASAPPPPTFLGPAELAAYERQFYDADRPRPLRPVSSAGQYSHPEREHPLTPSRSQQQPPGAAARKSGFWDGVRERFFLGRSKSSSDTSGGGVAAAIANPLIAPPPTGDYPTRDQVLASYQTLVSSGFFESHAIHGTRHPVPPNMGPMGPPPRPVSTPHPIIPVIPSPQRGTKRPTPADDIETETSGARKLVKKLRRSASRISVDLAVSFSSSKPNPPRPSTSSYTPGGGAASFVSSAASSIYEAPEPRPVAPKKKLTKPQPPMTAVTRRGGSGWRDRSRSRSRSRARPANPVPNPLAMNPVDQRVLHIPLIDDAMLLDVETPRPSTDTMASVGRGTVLHPPPSRGRATERRTSPRKAAGPLSVVPDANRGIPGVPRIPEGMLKRGGLSPAKEGGCLDTTTTITSIMGGVGRERIWRWVGGGILGWGRRWTGWRWMRIAGWGWGGDGFWFIRVS